MIHQNDPVKDIAQNEGNKNDEKQKKIVTINTLRINQHDLDVD